MLVAMSVFFVFVQSARTRNRVNFWSKSVLLILTIYFVLMKKIFFIIIGNKLGML